MIMLNVELLLILRLREWNLSWENGEGTETAGQVGIDQDLKYGVGMGHISVTMYSLLSAHANIIWVELRFNCMCRSPLLVEGSSGKHVNNNPYRNHSHLSRPCIRPYKNYKKRKHRLPPQSHLLTNWRSEWLNEWMQNGKLTAWLTQSLP